MFNLKIASAAGVAFILLLCLTLSSQFLENNQAGYMQVKQAATSGELSVRTEPGMYYQGWGTITTYPVSDIYDFNSEGKIDVRFNDGSTARISGQIKYRLPTNAESLLKIHQDFRSYDAVHNDLIRQVVASSLKQSATFFRAEDVYSTHRSEFIDLVNDQVKAGIYATSYGEEIRTDEAMDKTVRVKTVQVRRDREGSPIVNEKSAFAIYGIELIQLVINDIDFDDLTDGLIAKRKEAEQQQVVAKANAERAKQDALTAQEIGRRDVAEAEAKALTRAKTEVVNAEASAKVAIVAAEQQTKVAEQAALQAEQEKRAILARGEADAAATKLKVAAGLSPLEKANIDKETAIGVAGELAKVRLPQLMVIGGGDKAPVNPFDAVGLKSFIDISKSMSQGGER